MTSSLMLYLPSAASGIVHVGVCSGAGAKAQHESHPVRHALFSAAFLHKCLVSSCTSMSLKTWCDAGFLRVLLLSCRSRRLAQREAEMRLRRRYDIEAVGPRPVAQVDPPRKEQPRVMVVQPDEGICCGLQLAEASSKALQESSDSQNAAKLVDQASAGDQRR